MLHRWSPRRVGTEDYLQVNEVPDPTLPEPRPALVEELALNEDGSVLMVSTAQSHHVHVQRLEVEEGPDLIRVDVWISPTAEHVAGRRSAERLVESLEAEYRVVSVPLSRPLGNRKVEADVTPEGLRWLAESV